MWSAEEHDAVMEIVAAAQQWKVGLDAGYSTGVNVVRLKEAVQTYEELNGSDVALATTLASLLQIQEDLEDDGRGNQGLSDNG